MGTVVVNVMLKPEHPDTQGVALAGQLAAGGFGQFVEVRQGKRFVLIVDGLVTPEVLAAARKAAEISMADASTELVTVRDGADDGVDWDDMPEIWDDGAMLTAAQGMLAHGQDPREAAVRDHRTIGLAHAADPEVLQDLSGTGDFGVYGGSEDDDR